MPQGFIVSYDEGRFLYRFYELCHCKCLARAGRTEKDLCPLTALNAGSQRLYGFGLIACQLIRRFNAKRTGSVIVLIAFLYIHAVPLYKFKWIYCNATILTYVRYDRKSACPSPSLAGICYVFYGFPERKAANVCS